jgi:uncharacterized protein YjbJ (UPF0337 family)
MISQQTLQGNWNEIKGLLRSKWGELTDDDVTEFNGNVEQLLGTIQRKTGEARESVEQFFEQFNSNGASAINRASETVRAGAEHAVEAGQETSHRAAASVSEAYAEVEDMVRQRPIESIAICFGAGVITGVVVSLLLRGR